MKSVAVYCGANAGLNDIYRQQAEVMGQTLAERNMMLVYGGGRVGLMGAVADSVLRHGGRAIGVIPDFLVEKEVEHRGLTELHIVKSMHERKLLMADLAEGFVAMPGGYGTLEELFEVLTWAQLGLHRKPVAVLNVGGYYDQLLALLDTMAREGLLRQENRAQLLQHESPSVLLDKMLHFEPIEVEKWLTPPTT
ncbi:cytokinin riboside 5'-monophosphate phosphoribohydrolase [Hymenobacter qilianensis]|uniref:Cytokinin riboside 5'-monophosphate phosphoribohydrolase n=2 Tax=Hymenobacter qilianensis TaxID=1385715 RepID=A0A7H0GRW9_9BACT|nr:TIGR00730 family Rossman fold protein [Hymenobacter qilianensis]QNP51035.1 TIGR00730 family Rossman fold protein [Hymenobacter qilianensis]GGF78970.1 cytokinin riboside 5'-monophosphate phosphoribohydrolase [Hymenobacter qilianensis]